MFRLVVRSVSTTRAVLSGPIEIRGGFKAPTEPQKDIEDVLLPKDEMDNYPSGKSKDGSSHVYQKGNIQMGDSGESLKDQAKETMEKAKESGDEIKEKVKDIMENTKEWVKEKIGV